MTCNVHEENELPFALLFRIKDFLYFCLCRAAQGKLFQRSWACRARLPGTASSCAGARGCHWGCPACAAQTQLEAARGPWHHGQAPEGPSSSEGGKALCWHWPHPVLRAGEVTGLPCPISIAGPASSVLLAPLPRSDCVPSGRKANLGKEEIESGGGQTS